MDAPSTDSCSLSACALHIRSVTTGTPSSSQSEAHGAKPRSVEGVLDFVTLIESHSEEGIVDACVCVCRMYISSKLLGEESLWQTLCNCREIPNGSATIIAKVL